MIVPFAGVTAMTADIEVGNMLKSRQKRFPERRDKLVQLLQINLKWRMSQVGSCKAVGALKLISLTCVTLPIRAVEC